STISITTGDTNGVGPSSIPPVVPELIAGFVEVTQSSGRVSPASGNDVDKSVSDAGVTHGTVEVTMPCNNETHSGIDVLNGVVVNTPPDNIVDNSD
ncbi:hypothetical protein MKW92_044844, partial [Papaver armeniacum]